MKSLSRFALKVRLVEGHKSGRLRAGAVARIGPAIVVERLWRELGIGRVIEGDLRGRKFEFRVERAVFLTVLHRLFASGSDRAADKWKRDYRIEGADGLELHHLYRATRNGLAQVAWLGENKEAVEGSLPTRSVGPTSDPDGSGFTATRDLFTELDMVFFDTTSIYFEGEGGETLGTHGHSKDHRPDLKQMVVGACLDGEGRPVSCEMWAGNHADAKALVPGASGDTTLYLSLTDFFRRISGSHGQNGETRRAGTSAPRHAARRAVDRSTSSTMMTTEGYTWNSCASTASGRACASWRGA